MTTAVENWRIFYHCRLESSKLSRVALLLLVPLLATTDISAEATPAAKVDLGKTAPAATRDKMAPAVALDKTAPAATRDKTAPAVALDKTAPAASNAAPGSVVFLYDMRDKPYIAKTLSENKSEAGSQSYEFLKGRYLIAQKKHDEARKLCTIMRKEHPDWVAPYLLTGLIAEGEFDDDLAMAQYRRAIALNPNVILSWKLLSELLRHSTDYQGCIDICKRARSIVEGVNTVDGAIYRHNFSYCMVLCYNELKQYKNAIALLTEMSKNGNEIYAVQYMLAQAYIGDKQYQKAVDVCTRSLKDPSSKANSYEFYYLRGSAYSALGKYQLAIDDLTVLISKNRNVIAARSIDRKARELRAELYHKTGREAQSRRDLEFLRIEQRNAYLDTTFQTKSK